MEFVSTSVEKVECSVHDLQLGMYVSELDIPWLDSPFLFQGFVIESREDLQQLRQCCTTVKVDIQRSAARQQTDWGHVATVEDYAVSVGKELRAAADARRMNHGTINQLMRDIHRGRGIEGDAVQLAITDTVDSVMRNPDALMLLSQIRHADNYTAEHAMTVSWLAAAFSRYLGKSREDIESAAYSALLYDIGKIRVPEAVLNKRGGLNSDELKIMQCHTELGSEILAASNSIPQAAINAALAHHESVDGTGYPHALGKDIIPYDARLIAIADTYDAMTSVRCYRRAKSPFDALQEMYGQRNRHFDAELVERFIEFMGVYPTGSVVEMSNGEAGIVLSVHPKHKLEPRVMIVRDRSKEPTSRRIIDLRTNPKDNLGDPYRIESTHPNGSFEIEIKKYLTRSAHSRGMAEADS